MKPFYRALSELQNAARFVARPSRSVMRKEGNRSTVASPNRKAYPKVYRDPSTIVEESAQKVSRESPLLQQLFGVSRQDLDALARERYARGDTLEPQELWAPPKGGPAYIENVKTPANTQRVQDTIVLAASDPRFAGNFGWYENQPLLDKYIERWGPLEGTRRFERHHKIGSAFSPGSAVEPEIKRNSLADEMSQRGLGAAFLDRRTPELMRMRAEKYGIPKDIAKKMGPTELDWFRREGEEFLPKGYGHLYHSTAHQNARPMLEGGEDIVFDPKGQVKTGLYYNARTGRNMDYPVPDAHFGRFIGVPDVRKSAAGVGGSLSADEYWRLQPWFREEVLKGTGIPGVPAQALMWNAGAGSTGVETAVGAPYLELLARAVGRRAKQLGEKPMDVLNRFLEGKERLAGVGAAGILGAGAMGAPEEAEAAVSPKILEQLRGALTKPEALDAFKRQILESRAGEGPPIYDPTPGGGWSLPDEYKQALPQTRQSGMDFKPADPETFRRALTEAQGATPNGLSVYAYSPEEYAGMKTFLSEDGMTGFAVKPDGDIVSVFNHPQSPNRGAVGPMLMLAHEQGGKKLDAFDPVLPSLYSEAGFRESARLPFDPNEAPPGWDTTRQGTPDVVAMHADLSQRPMPGAERPRAPVVGSYDEFVARQAEDVKRAEQSQAARRTALATGLLGGPPAAVQAAVNPGAGDLASQLERVESPLGLGSPESLTEYLRDLEYGRKSGYGTLLGAGLDLLDPATMYLTGGHLMRNLFR